MRSRSSHIAPLLVLLLLGSCDTTKRVPPGSYLLNRNRIDVAAKSVDPAELEAILKQKPNKRILGVPFYLGLFNMRDPVKVRQKRIHRDSICAERNIERVARGKRERACDRSLRPRSGEPPVLLDTGLVRRSADQLKLYMNKEGWFDAAVSDTVYHHRKKLLSTDRGKAYARPKVEVRYTILPDTVYRYRKITYTVDDPTIAGYIQETWSESLLKPGDRYDYDVLDAERARVADRLRELGYLYFSRELILYDANPTVGDHEVDIIMRVERPFSKTERGLAGTREGTIYTIRDVTILTDRSSNGADLDTTEYQGYKILHRGPLAYRPKALVSSIFLKPEDRFQQSHADNTYRRLTGSRVFDRVEISYDTVGIGRLGSANARITLLPGKEQTMALEGYGTNRGGFLGTTLTLGYRHRNLMGTLGYIQTQLNLGFEAQQVFTVQDDPTRTNQVLLGEKALFNTISIGPEVTLGFPRPFSSLFSKSSGSRLLVNSSFNFQRRPDFTRTLAKGGLALEWNETPTKTWNLTIVELNAIRIPSKSAEFDEFLFQTNDPVFTNSYTDHLIFNFPRATFTWNTQGIKHTRNVFYMRSSAELAGTAIGLFLGNSGTLTDSTTGRDYRTLFGVRYAEYFKIDNDFRFNHTIHDRSSLAFRVAAGIGLPYRNLEVLPFESSFFGGGANGIRAWRARSLGPGSYSAPLLAFDRLGEIRIEANLEYRFKLIGYLEGALFTDVGNIWNRRKDPRRPGAEFDPADFLSELAVGTGAGARLNFDFFIIRFDLGMQTKDPSLPVGERWLFQPKEQYEADQAALGFPVNYRTQFNFNLGIGYPF